MIKSILNWIKFKLNQKGDVQTTTMFVIGAFIIGAILLGLLIYFLFSTSQSKLGAIFD